MSFESSPPMSRLANRAPWPADIWPRATWPASPMVIVLGRHEDCDLVVDDPYASPRHAQVVVHETGETFIEDLGSTNGTYVRRGQMRWKVRMNSPLEPGDVITIGRSSITWKGLPA